MAWNRQTLIFIKYPEPYEEIWNFAPCINGCIMHDVSLQIRNLRFRPMTDREKQIVAEREEKKKQEAIRHRNLEEYLAKDYTSGINKIIVTSETINIIGTAESTDPVYVCEVYHPIWMSQKNRILKRSSR